MSKAVCRSVPAVRVSVSTWTSALDDVRTGRDSSWAQYGSNGCIPWRRDQELSTCLKPLIRRLGAADLQALQLVEFEGVTQVDAAERIGLCGPGMKSPVQRARLHLRTALDECCQIALDRRGGIISYEARTDSAAPAGTF